jgi:hypothetical protein
MKKSHIISKAAVTLGVSTVLAGLLAAPSSGALAAAGTQQTSFSTEAAAGRPPCRIYHHGVIRSGVHTYCGGLWATGKIHRVRAECRYFNHNTGATWKVMRWGKWAYPGHKSSLTCPLYTTVQKPWIDVKYA